MKITLHLILGLAFSTLANLPAQAQTFEWVKSEQVTGSLTSVQAYCTATDLQGNVLFAGLQNKKAPFNNSIGDGGDVFLKQYNRAGDLVFDKPITGKALVQTIHYNSAGHFYLVGLFNDSARFDSQHVLVATESTPIPFIAKYSASGQVQWVRNMRASNSQARTIGSVTTDVAGNLYVAFNDFTSHQTFIKKFDDAGMELLHIAQTNVRVVASVVTDAAGNLYVSGSCAETGALFNGTDFGDAHNYEQYLVSYTPAGTARWIKFAEDNSCYHSDLAIDNSGHLYWAGPLFASTTFDTITAAGSTWSHDFFLTRFDTDGNIQWLREVPQVNGADAAIGFHSNKISGKCITTDASDNVYLAGYMRNTLDWGNGIVNTSAGFYDMMVQKYQPDGTLEWSKTAGGTGSDKATSIAVNSYGEVFIAATAQDTITLDSIQHTQSSITYPVLAKIAPAPDTTIISTPVIHTKKLNIYPNPVSTEVRIAVDKQIDSGDIVLYNSLGQQVLQQRVNANQTEMIFDLKRVPAGMYVVQLQSGDNVYRQRLVKQ